VTHSPGMSGEEMTLAKALVELKLLDKRIRKKLSSLEPVAVKKGGKFVAAITSQEEFEREAKAAWQSLQDMTRRRREIKAALVLANAVTPVKIAGETMTIAEAIEKKNMIDLEETIVQQLRLKVAKAHQEVDEHNALMKNKLLRLLETTYGKREAQLSKDDHDRIAKPFNEANEAKLIDPMNGDKTATEMEDKFELFRAEVDVCLSIANATTTIAIS
jgi:hypothetical protein